MRKLSRLLTTLGALVVGLSAVAAVSANNAGGSGGVTGPAFYVDGELYRTVGTPTDLSHTGAPGHTFDVIYDLSGVQRNVAEAAPGDRDYNGGRWMVHLITFQDYQAALEAGDANDNGTLDSAEEVEAALDSGSATDQGVVAKFVCPVIHVPQGN